MRVLFLFVLLPVFGFSQSVTGLWLVTKVQMGEEQMTPVARWMRFEADGFQESGNGWKKHSEGSYTFDQKDSLLSVYNWNGLKDDAPPFKVRFDADTMKWQRAEGEQNVEVLLVPIGDLPISPSDLIMGFWVINDAKSIAEEEAVGSFFFRWDNVFVFTDTSGEKAYGVYKCHAHKPEVELVYYGEECRREWWAYSVDRSDLSMVNTQNENQEYLLKRSE